MKKPSKPSEPTKPTPPQTHNVHTQYIQAIPSHSFSETTPYTPSELFRLAFEGYAFYAGYRALLEFSLDEVDFSQSTFTCSSDYDSAGVNIEVTFIFKEPRNVKNSHYGVQHAEYLKKLTSYEQKYEKYLELQKNYLLDMDAWSQLNTAESKTKLALLQDLREKGYDLNMLKALLK